jgi:hypothetical protein
MRGSADGVRLDLRRRAGEIIGDLQYLGGGPYIALYRKAEMLFVGRAQILQDSEKAGRTKNREDDVFL